MIYLVKNSPYNEDFLLAGYAVDLAGIKEIVRNYYREVYHEDCDPTIVVDYAKNEVVIKSSKSYESDTTMFLVPIPQVEVLG